MNVALKFVFSGHFSFETGLLRCFFFLADFLHKAVIIRWSGFFA